MDENDADNVFFSSVNLHADSRFYPCSGQEESPEELNEHPNVMNISLTPVGPGPWDQKNRVRLSNAQKIEYCKLASQEMRNKFNTKLLPKLASFQPHLLFISAGFDAHYDDMYHYLTEDDYHWMTKQLIHACNVQGKVPHNRDNATGTGRESDDNGYYYQGEVKVVSVLEGGYSLSSSTPPLDTTAPQINKVVSGRGGRGKAKANALSTQKSSIISTLGMSSNSSDPSLDTSGVSDSTGHAGAAHKYLLQQGDGGLVKGVLAHITALVEK